MSGLQQPENFESFKTKISTAAIVGHTTPTSSKLWIRAYREGVWHLVLSERPLEGDLSNLDEQDLDSFISDKVDSSHHLNHHFKADSDKTKCFEISTLKPDTKYYYYLIADESINSSIEKLRSCSFS